MRYSTSGNVISEAENLVSSSEKALGAKRLKEEHLNQVVKTQDSAQDSSDSRNAILVMRIQDSTQDSTQDFTQDSIKVSFQDSIKDSSQDSIQDSSQDCSITSSNVVSMSGNSLSSTSKTLGSHFDIFFGVLKDEDFTQEAVLILGNFAKTIFGSTRTETGTRNGLNGLKEEHITQLLTLENFDNRSKSSTKSGFQSRLDSTQDFSNSFVIRIPDSPQDSSQDSIQDSSQNSSQDSIQDSSQDFAKDSTQDSSNAKNSQVVSGVPNLRLRIDSILKRIRTMIPSVISSIESDIAKRNEDNLIQGLPNFFGMFFGCLAAVAAEINRQSCLDVIDTENQEIHNLNENGNMGCRVYKGGAHN